MKKLFTPHFDLFLQLGFSALSAVFIYFGDMPLFGISLLLSFYVGTVKPSPAELERRRLGF